MSQYDDGPKHGQSARWFKYMRDSGKLDKHISEVEDELSGLVKSKGDRKTRQIIVRYLESLDDMKNITEEELAEQVKEEIEKKNISIERRN